MKNCDKEEIQFTSLESKSKIEIKGNELHIYHNRACKTSVIPEIPNKDSANYGHDKQKNKFNRIHTYEIKSVKMKYIPVLNWLDIIFLLTLSRVPRP